MIEARVLLSGTSNEGWTFLFIPTEKLLIGQHQSGSVMVRETAPSEVVMKVLEKIKVPKSLIAAARRRLRADEAIRGFIKQAAEEK